jgi:hypothetical protein
LKELLESAAKISSPFAVVAYLGVVLLGLVWSTKKAGSQRKLILIIYLILCVLGFVAVVILAFLPYVPESITIGVPANTSFGQAVKMVAKNDNHVAIFDLCDDALLDTKLEPGPLSASNHTNLLQLLQYRLVDPPAEHTYHVAFLKDKGIYEIHCDR